MAPVPVNTLNTPPRKSSLIKDWPAAERPRERLVQSGPGHLTDAEVLSIRLGRGVAGVSALDLARQLLARFGGMRGVLNAGHAELETLHGLGPGKSATLRAARECCCRYMGEKLSPGKTISSPGDSQDFLLARLRDRPHEVFCCLFLDSRHRLISCEELFRGTVDGASVHPREVVKQALSRNATAVILAHNHPSGVAEPSQADEIITTRLRDALALVEIRLLDHLIIGDGNCTSLAEKGLI